MDRDYRQGYPNAGTVVVGDLADIQASDVVLVKADKPTWGTAMEIPYAYFYKKQIFIVRDVEWLGNSPWLEFHATQIFPDLEQAAMQLQRVASMLYDLQR